MSLQRDPSRASRREGMVSLRNPQQAHETIRFQDAALRGGCAYRISQGSSTGGEALGGSRAAILQVMSPQLAMCAPAERGAASRAVYREGERQEHNELTLQEAADRLDVSKIAVLRQIRRSVISCPSSLRGSSLGSLGDLGGRPRSRPGRAGGLGTGAGIHLSRLAEKAGPPHATLVPAPKAAHPPRSTSVGVRRMPSTAPRFIPSPGARPPTEI